MGTHPLNLALRFILELAIIGALVVWASAQSEGLVRLLLIIGLPVVAAALWGTFAVPDDPSRSGKAPVPVPGWVRLLLELGLFVAGTLAFLDAGWVVVGIVFAVIAILHYIVSYDRIAWLLRQ